jgi:transposase-like protein
MPQKYIADMACVSENIVIGWCNRIRKAISQYFELNPLVLGKHHPVQIDESLFGGKSKYRRGGHARHTQVWVFGIIEENTKLCYMCTVDDRKQKTLLPIISRRVHAGATIKSDEWSSYKILGECGFAHLTVNHSVGFVKDRVHTQLVESLWSQVKSIIRLKRGIRASHLQGYLDYYSFMRLAMYLNVPFCELFLRLIQIKNPI